ncbi:PilZ domain-containing protein [Aeromonas finlandensis]|uniref:PilZ domain-containing protein n=1 Tax=Aeromonas finlandensis TaxID=1543375 RepID=UPI00051B61B0|nr:PilZ domain-containing protein [Aeromonas finlandensis]
MTQQTQQSPFKSIKDRIKANKEKGVSIQGPDVMDYLYPASKVGIEVITPTGQLRSLPAVLIGADKARVVYFSLPATTPADAALYCQPGYRATAAIICERGIGAMICFEGLIDQFNKQPQLFTMRQPETITLFKIRKEVRYPISCEGIALLDQRPLNIHLVDFSLAGCAFSTDHQAPAIPLNHPIELRLSAPTSNGVPYQLTGTVRNQRQINNYPVYGMQFDSAAQQQSGTFLQHLEFNGHQMVVRTQPESVTGLSLG